MIARKRCAFIDSETSFQKVRAIRLTRIVAAVRTMKASAEDGVAS
jgi:hypothetical protein